MSVSTGRHQNRWFVAVQLCFTKKVTIISIMKNHCKLLLSCRRRQMFRGKHLSPLPQAQLQSPPLLPPPCVFAAAPHASLSGCSFGVLFHGFKSDWEEAVLGLGWFTASPHTQDTLWPQTLLFVLDEASRVSIISRCRLKEFSLLTKPLF